MITKEKIIKILQNYSYNIEDQSGNDIIVVDSDSWDDVAEIILKRSKINSKKK